MARQKLTKAAVDALPFSDTGQKIYFDTELSGFLVCIGKRTKTYYTQRQIGPKTVRVKIGGHDVYSAEKARSEARLLIARILQGENPNETKRAARSRSITLDKALSDYLTARESLVESTVETYGRVVTQYLGSWRNTSLCEIKPAMVQEMHLRLTKERGGVTANTAMRVFRAIYNYAAAFHDELPNNPVNRLTQARAWNRETRRQTVIKSADLPNWYAAVDALDHQIARDYLRLLLFTGMRRSEAARLRWENVDLNDRTFSVPLTKNHDCLTLPMSDYLFDLFERRREVAGENPWLFPGDGKSGHLEEPRKFIQQVRRNSGVDFTLHDLRRTFITIAESLDLSVYAIKRLLNHRDGRDVTSGYIIHSVERLREPMQRITDKILLLANQERDQKFPYDRQEVEIICPANGVGQRTYR